MTDNKQFDPELEADTELMAYVDGTLPPDRMNAVEARLAADPAARAATSAWRHHDNLIRQMGQSADGQPVNLRTAALERELVAKLRARKRRAMMFSPVLGQVAAAVFLFAAGWGAHAMITEMRGPASYPQFVNAAIAEHTAYRQANLLQASFTSDEMDRAVEWMSEQMQRKISSPKLEQYGYQVQSARLLNTEEGPLGIFYFLDAEGQTITLAVKPHDDSVPDYRFRIVDVNNERLAYWNDEGLDYSLLANVTTAMMTTLAAAVSP